MLNIHKSKSNLLYPADLLEKAFKKYYPDIELELGCEPFLIPNKPYWAFDNYRCNGALDGGSPLFYTQPGWGTVFDQKGRMNNKCITYACDPELHKPVDVEKEYEVGFIGNGGGEGTTRGEYLELIKNNFNCLVTDKVSSENLGLEYSKCKVIFNHIRYEEVNIRFFEALALGVQVCTHSPCLNLFAQEGKHYLTYRTKEEAIEKIKFLLEHDDIREKMTKEARKHAIENHTYKHRLEEMLIFMDLIKIIN